MFFMSGSDFVVLLAVAAVVLGPERLPRYAQQLAQIVRQLRGMAAAAQEQVRDELGPDFDDVDWRALDPRRYDPRRIVRDALSDAVDLGDPMGLGSDPLGLKSISPGRPTKTSPAVGESISGGGSARPSSSAQPPERPPAPTGDGPLFDPDAT